MSDIMLKKKIPVYQLILNRNYQLMQTMEDYGVCNEKGLTVIPWLNNKSVFCSKFFIAGIWLYIDKASWFQS